MRSIISGAIPARWAEIDTVLLDMDGTLLDLAYDNHFWRHTVPAEWGRTRGLSADGARQELVARFRAAEGTLDWYCVDFWTRELQLDLDGLKRAHAGAIDWLPGAREFLAAVRALGKRLVLLTNAHPRVLALKHERTRVQDHFDDVLSSHQTGVPKEDVRFWQRLDALGPLDPARALFVDDSLPVLRSARRAGISHLYCVQQPDSRAEARTCDEFDAVGRLTELLPTPPSNAD